MNKTIPTNLDGNIHPIVSLVKPRGRGQFKLNQTILVLKLRKEGCSYNTISKRLYAEHGIDLSPQRVNDIYKRFQEGEQYV